MNNKHTLLIEIGTEELPSKILKQLGESFSKNFNQELNLSNISYKSIYWYASPRRLAIKVININSCQEDKEIVKRGPSIAKAFDYNGIPTPAANSWVKSCGITIKNTTRLVTKKGEWLIYRNKLKGKNICYLLCNIITNSLNKLPSTQMMYWGISDVKFIRPIHTVTVLLDNQVITGKVLGIQIDRIIYGHRFIGKQIICLQHANDYLKILLTKGMVIADFQQRKEIIYCELKKAAKLINGKLDFNNNLLEEVTSLVEWPVILTGKFDKHFLIIPQEILILVMTKNQKYFPIYNINGKLKPYFLFVTNIVSQKSQKIIAGNEKVIHSRFSDALFFFKSDCKIRLIDRLPLLDLVLFKTKLGSLLNKSKRLQTLAIWIAHIIGADINQTSRAGILSKCDLITKMVYEFPDTQGVMGMYYAQYDNELPIVALALKEQYYPRFSKDILPTTLVSCTLAIADKIDTIVGLFGIGFYSFKGDKDPFAIRRAALGIWRIIIENNLVIDLKLLIKESVRIYGKIITNQNVIEDIINFMLNRFIAWYIKKGYRVDIIKAVLCSSLIIPTELDNKLRYLSDFMTKKESTLLIATNKRILNILNKNIDLVPNLNLIDNHLQHWAEIDLMQHLFKLQKIIPNLILANKYQEALLRLLTLIEPINNFFKNVMVINKNIYLQNNRLLLLNKLHKLFLTVADWSKIQ